MSELLQDLFGDVPAAEPNGRGKHYVKAWGYACPPGTGPEGHSCGDCVHHVRKRMAKTYHKCFLAQAKWTGGRASDILVRAPACSKWEAQNTSSS